MVKVTAERYLAIDRAAEERSEFRDGVMLPRSGVSLRHASLQMNALGELHAILRETNCQVLPSSLRVCVSPGPMYVYPDLMVVWGKPELADGHQDILLNPRVVFEVLSPESETYDRSVKLRSYLAMESVTDYVLVDQSTMRVEQYSRGADDTWTFRSYERSEDQLKLESIGASILLARIYAGVELAPPED